MEKFKATDPLCYCKELSVRFLNVCKSNGISTFGELAAIPRDRILQLHNFGRKSFKEYKNIIDRIEREEPKPEQQPTTNYIATTTRNDNGEVLTAYDTRKISFVGKFEDTEIHIIIDGVLLRWSYLNEKERNENFDQIHNFLKQVQTYMQK